jgi:hypothetical protein
VFGGPPGRDYGSQGGDATVIHVALSVSLRKACEGAQQTVALSKHEGTARKRETLSPVMYSEVSHCGPCCSRTPGMADGRKSVHLTLLPHKLQVASLPRSAVAGSLHTLMRLLLLQQECVTLLSSITDAVHAFQRGVLLLFHRVRC